MKLFTAALSFKAKETKSGEDITVVVHTSQPSAVLEKLNICPTDKSDV